MTTKEIGKRITAMRKEWGHTQESPAELLDVSPQAVSKWENGHALPETALLPFLAKALDTSIDALFTDRGIQILSALYGDGMKSYSVATRLNKLVVNDDLEIDISDVSLAFPVNNNRVKYLIVKYQTEQGLFYAFAAEKSRLSINTGSKGLVPSGKRLLSRGVSYKLLVQAHSGAGKMLSFLLLCLLPCVDFLLGTLHLVRVLFKQ